MTKGAYSRQNRRERQRTDFSQSSKTLSFIFNSMGYNIFPSFRAKICLPKTSDLELYLKCDMLSPEIKYNKLVFQAQIIPREYCFK